MIIPTQITNYSRTDKELQLFWLFGIVVAGRNLSLAKLRAINFLIQDETVH